MNTLLDSNDALRIVAEHYELTDLDYCMFIERGFNDTYLIATENKKYIFRIYLNGKYYIDSNTAYQFELDLLDHLHTRGIPVANAVRNKRNEFLGTTATSLGDRAFALFNYADGISLRGRSITVEQCYQLGVAMADMHLAANVFSTTHKRYTLDTNYLIDEPLRLISEIPEQRLQNDEVKSLVERGQHIVQRLQPIDELVNVVNNITLNNDEFGIIHADLHPGNLHFHGQNLTMFDFDHCAYGWRAYDLAIAYHSSPNQRDSIIKGYESRRPLSEQERKSMQCFSNLRNLWDIGDTLATLNLREEI